MTSSITSPDKDSCSVLKSIVDEEENRDDRDEEVEVEEEEEGDEK